MLFHGKNIVVTGGANGIGLAISRNIAAAGGSVWIFDLESENPAEAARSIGCRPCIADVTDRPSFERAFEQAAVPDVVVVNAGVGRPAALPETTADLWNRTLAVNLTGAFHTVQIAAERMNTLCGLTGAGRPRTPDPKLVSSAGYRPRSRSRARHSRYRRCSIDIGA